MRNKFLEELLETVQDLIRRLVRCIHKLSGPEPEPTLLEKIINFCWSLYLSLFEVKILSPETCSGPAGFTKVGPATLVSWVIPFG